MNLEDFLITLGGGLLAGALAGYFFRELLSRRQHWLLSRLKPRSLKPYTPRRGALPAQESQSK